MITTVIPFAPKGAESVRLPAPAAQRLVLRATWTLDPETGRPVCHWSAEGEGTDTPTPLPLPLRRAA
ncbi:hypothetical protein ABZT49_29850 [Methylobacterium sp. EM32]|uniref:hypothetical protein n=1 Tax=Methylobacterium sp. EM32 TaxID=3163481 RepID=UPI0033BA6641